jgi:hypothetical protein
MNRSGIAVFILALVVAVACQTAGVSTTPDAPVVAASPAPRADPAVTATPAAAMTEVEQDRAHDLEEAKKLIAGRENLPAEQVFKNIKVLTGVPAGRVLAIMDQGWSRSLGVSCHHCHEEADWSSDGKPQKDIAREMSRMTRKINEEMLKPIANLKGPNPVVNCTTCHRGQVKPALSL